jgi:hypothetical protein
MKGILFALAMTQWCALPALAQEAPTLKAMSCADFVGLSADEQMKAMSDAQPAPGEAKDEATPASEQAAAATMAACTEHPDMMLDDAPEAGETRMNSFTGRPP